MNIVCTTVENYKLTLGAIYEVHDESRDFYTIINDNGIGVRYSKRLFSLEREEVVVPPPPPARTEADVIASITYNNAGNVQFTDLVGNLNIIRKRFNTSNSNISCGVSQTSGINNQIAEIDEFFDLGEDDFLAIRKALLTKCIEEYVLHARNAGNQIMTLMSTNVTGVDDDNEADEDMLMVLDELAHKTSNVMTNPNSGRDIKVWIMQYRRQ